MLTTIALEFIALDCTLLDELERDELERFTALDLLDKLEELDTELNRLEELDLLDEIAEELTRLLEELTKLEELDLLDELEATDELDAIDELDIADELSELEILELDKTIPPSALDELAELFDVLAIEDRLDELKAKLDELAIRLDVLLDETTRLDIELDTTLDDNTGLDEATVLDGLGEVPLEPEPPPHAVSDVIKIQENNVVKPGRKKCIATPNRHAGEMKKQLICRFGGVFLV